MVSEEIVQETVEDGIRNGNSCGEEHDLVLNNKNNRVFLALVFHFPTDAGHTVSFETKSPIEVQNPLFESYESNKLHHGIEFSDGYLA